MGIAERREREREALRTQIVEAARDILSDQGLDALSMRAIAERIEYSPATIYLYFKDKTELIGEVVHQGFERLHEYMMTAMQGVSEQGPMEEYRAMGGAYARFGLENTAYFRVMFELPGVAQLDCAGEQAEEGVAGSEEPTFGAAVETVRRAVEQGLIRMDPMQGALIGWGLVHGLTSLYLGGHLRDAVGSHEEFMELIESAQGSLYHGWRSPEPAGSPLETGTASAA